jgi:hypothetical protein
VISQLFAPPEKEEKRFGWRYNGRYHMPLLPGENGTKSCPKDAIPWVPYGIQSTTEMVSAFAESRALNMWEQEQILYGMYRNPSLFEKACLMFAGWEREGVDFTRIKDFPHVRKALTGTPRGNNDDTLIGQAKQAAGANEAREAGNTRHQAWEHYCKTGELIGTPEMQRQITCLIELLERKRLQVMPALSECVVRNTAVNAAGRFDNVLLDQATGRLLMADLKTKKKAFWTWMEVDGQLAVYARSDWMLSWDAQDGATPDVPVYIPGPVHHVDQKVGVVLQMPSDGKPAYLRPANLTFGWEVAKDARRIIERRAYGKSAERMAMREWR